MSAGPNDVVWQFVRPTDPADSGGRPVRAGMYWLDTSTTPFTIYRRNEENSGWDEVGGHPGGSGQPVTVVDSATIDLDVTGNTVTASVKPASITAAYLADDYLTPTEADALFLTPSEANALYAPAGSALTSVTDSATIDLTFAGNTLSADVKPASITAGMLVDDYLTASEGNALFLTQAEADALYAPIGGGGSPITVTDTASLDLTLNAGALSGVVVNDAHTHATQYSALSHVHANDHAPVTVTDSATLDFTLTGQDVTASIKPGSVSASMLVDDYLTPEEGDALFLTPTEGNALYAPIVHTHAGVAHDPVTVTDSATIDLTLAGAGGQDLTASIKTGSVTAAMLADDYLTAAEGDALFLTPSEGNAAYATSGHTHTNDHVPVTVSDTASIDLTLVGQQVSAAAIFGTTATTIAAGDHTHAQLHAAVTVTDSATIDFTLTGQDITAIVKPASITAAMLVDDYLTPAEGDALFLTQAEGDARYALTGAGVTSVTDTASIDLTLSAGALSAAAIFGTTATTIAQGNHVHANDHVAVTVLDTASIDLTLSGQQISAAAIFGSTATTIAAGNHNHDAAYQPLNAILTDVAGLTQAANVLPYFDSATTAATTPLTTAGRALLDDADATAQRTTLGLGTIATQNASAVSISGGTITGITDLAIADGGTGASTATAAFNALSPLTTKGDLVARDATNNVRVAVGTDGQVLTADAASSAGVKWAAVPTGFVTSVTDTASIDLTVSAGALSAAAIFGTTATTIAAGNHSHANDHVAATVLDTTSIDLTISGQQISGVVVADTTVQRVEVVKNSGAVVATRKQLNLIEGSNVTLTIADDSVNNQVDITIASASAPVQSVSDTASIDLTLSAGVLSAAAIFGTTATTVAVGNHTHANDHVAATVLDTASIDLTLSGQQISGTVIANTTVQKVEVVKNSGAVVGTRKQLNLIEGSNVTLTIADDAANDQVDITIAAASGGGLITAIGDTASIDLTVTTGTLTAAAIFGTTATTVAAGNHNHDTAYQPLNAILTDFAGMTQAANVLPYFDTATTATTTAITAAGRALIDDADAAAQRTTLGLAAGGAGDIWVEKAGDVMTGALIVRGSLAPALTVTSGVLSTDSTLDVDAVAKSIKLYNGALLRGFSDDGVTEKWSVASATGNAQFDGTMTVDGATDLNALVTIDVTGAALKIRNAAGSTEFLSADTSAGLIWQAVSQFAFRVRDAATPTKTVLNVDTSNGYLETWNGGVMRGFSDARTTETFSISGASGNAQFDGTGTFNGSLIAQSDGTRALVARTGAAADIFYVDTTAPGVRVRGDGTSALLVMKADGTTNVLVVDNSGGTLKLQNAFDLIVSDGNPGTQRFTVDGATGNVMTLGTLDVNSTTIHRNGVSLYSGSGLGGYSDAGVTNTWSIDTTLGSAQFDGGMTVNGDMLVQRDGGSAFRVQTAAAVTVLTVNASTSAGAVTIAMDSQNVLQCRNQASTKRPFIVDCQNGIVKHWDGAVSRWYSDSGTTVTAEISGSTGSLQLDGDIDMLEIAAPATPASGTVTTYAGVDNRLHSIGDDGENYAIGQPYVTLGPLYALALAGTSSAISGSYGIPSAATTWAMTSLATYFGVGGRVVGGWIQTSAVVTGGTITLGVSKNGAAPTAIATNLVQLSTAVGHTQSWASITKRSLGISFVANDRISPNLITSGLTPAASLNANFGVYIVLDPV